MSMSRRTAVALVQIQLLTTWSSTAFTPPTFPVFAPGHRSTSTSPSRPTIGPGSRTVFRCAKKPWWKVWNTAEGEDGGDITSSPVFLQKKLEVLEKELETQGVRLAEAEAAADAEAAEWGPQIERLNKEFGFLQARTLNETKEADVMARAAVVKEILPVLDNFERAKASLKASSEQGEAILKHYETIFEDVQGILGSFDLKTVPALGTEFDYNLHEAIQQTPSDEYDEDVVCQVFQEGYMIGDKLVRPAIVAVSIGS